MNDQPPHWEWSQVCDNLFAKPGQARLIFQQSGVTAELLSSLQNPPRATEPYGRRVLFSSGKFEVMLASWREGAECLPHNHGFSQGLVWLVEGTFVENHFEFKDGGLNLIETSLHGAASTIVPVDEPDIHSMRAPHGGLSLHVYCPPIHLMKVYDPENYRTLVVSDDCGAWIPADKTLIVDVKPWPKPNSPVI
ncbi:MAG: cysteine dioxygenase [Bdellovibrionales bacterium]